MADKNILEGLDNLIKKAKAKKLEAQKEAGDISSKLDNADDGESPASTGEQAAAQISAQKEQYPDNAADVNASENPTGESVDMSSDDATAASPSGQEGSQGSEVSEGEPDKADNGDEVTDIPENNGWDSGAFKNAAEELRKQANELRKLADSTLSPLDRFLAKAARATDDEELKKQAMEMDDAQLADAAATSLMEQLESGQIGDEEATAILQEAASEGAIRPEEIDMAAGNVGAVDPGDMMEAKLAAAEIGPDHPEYLKKIATLYPTEVQAGYAFAAKLAEEMMEEEDESYEDDEDDSYDKDKRKEKKEARGDMSYDKDKKKRKKKAGDEMSYEDGREEESYEESYEEDGEHEREEKPPENGGGDEMPPEEGEMPPEEGGEMPPEEGEYAGEESNESEVEGALEDELTPATPEEEAALGAVGGELGLDDAALQQLMAAPLPPEAGMEIGKVAKALKTAGVSPQNRYRTVLLQKVAALRS